jgi:pimeloyl-ACP methyl ester carboxylesterase
MFALLLPALATTRQVIAVELQAHGHTADIDRPLSHEQMADDIAALIKYLGLANADIFGYSMGGEVAWQTAIRHPDVVRRLVVVSAPCKNAGWHPDVVTGREAMSAEAMTGTIMHEAYVNTAPNPTYWPKMVAKMKQFNATAGDYDWSKDVAAIKALTLIVIGDADFVRLDHAAEMFGLLGGGKVDWGMGGVPKPRLAVLPGTTHFTIFARTDLLLPILTPFLDAPMPAAN